MYNEREMEDSLLPMEWLSEIKADSVKEVGNTTWWMEMERGLTSTRA
jgi:hypothetical protein